MRLFDRFNRFWANLALCYRSVVYLSCLSVTLMYCGGQTVGWIKMKPGTEVGLWPGYIVLDGDPAPPRKRGTALQFSARVCCGHTAGWIKMPLGTKVSLGPGHILLHGDPALPKNWHSLPIFGSMSIVAKRSPISATAEHLSMFKSLFDIELLRIKMQ